MNEWIGVGDRLAEDIQTMEDSREVRTNEWMNRSGKQRPVEDVKAVLEGREVRANEWMNRSDQQRPVEDVK